MKKLAVYTSFESLPPSYPALFAEAAGTCGFFFSLPWYCHLAATTLKNQQLRIYTVESQKPTRQADLVLAMCHGPSKANIFEARRLNAAANFYTSLFGPLTTLAGADLRSSLISLAAAIASERPGWDILDMHPMAADEPVYDMMAVALREAGMRVQRYFCFGNWYLQVKERSYQEYFAALPSKLKNTLARKSRHLAKSHRLRIDILSTEAETAEAIAAFQQVYRSSWKPAEAFPDFIAGLISLCAQQGWLRMGVAYIDDQPAAAQLWIVHHRTAAIYKLAYDKKFSAFSIGSILTARLMEHVLDVDRVTEVDYLTGDDPYKRDWMTHRRERWGIVAFNLRTLRGKLGAVRHIGGHAVKRFLRHISSRMIQRGRA